MDLETMEFRAACIRAVREFFVKNGYLELDTPALAERLIPETCLEVFKTEYLKPHGSNSRPVNGSGQAEKRKTLFLTPSPEVFIKPIIAQIGRPVFQISKCYRNTESAGRIHSPEFTMLEYYTVNADYKDSIKITEKLFSFILKKIKTQVLFSSETAGLFGKKFTQLTMDEAFKKYAGFSLAENHSSKELAAQAERLGLGEAEKYETWNNDDLYELILVHAVEPALPENTVTALLDYPAFVPCLAKENGGTVLKNGTPKPWHTMERWEIYARGVELANCYTEARDKEKINAYFKNEDRLKQQHARVPHPAVQNFGEICSKMPPCSGVAMGLDRLIMLLASRSNLESVLF